MTTSTSDVIWRVIHFGKNWSRVIFAGNAEKPIAMQSFSQTVQWYRSRLGAMSVSEVIHRIAEFARKSSDYFFRRGWAAMPAAGELRLLTHLCLHVDRASPDLMRSISKEASKIHAGQLQFLDKTWATCKPMPPNPIFWHLGPDATLWSQPQKYYFRPELGAPRGAREKKYLWELNRLQFIVPLAMDFKLGGNRASRDIAYRIVFSWIQGNTPYRGFNWASGIEIALRAISVAFAISLMGTEHLSQNQTSALEHFFSAHMTRLDRYPSLYSSANNHRIAELAAIIVCSLCVPRLKGAKRLRKRSWAKLLEEIELQILPDGVGAEQSPSYSAFVVELLLVACFALEVRQEGLPDAVRERLAAWADHTRWMMDSAGIAPAIGDCDEGKVIALSPGHESGYLSSIVASVASYLQRPDLAPPRTDDHLRHIFFGSLKENAPIGNGLRTWKNGGYSVWRTRPAKPIVLVLDHGPLGYLSLAAHGHADALAIWLSVGDKQVIVDAGTYCYNINPAWRDRFRSTYFHNTLCVAGVSSSQSLGSFIWKKKANGYVVSATQNAPSEITVEHDGYVKSFGVRHRRTIQFIRDESIIIIDELIGKLTEQTISVSFLINQEFFADLDDKQYTAVNVHNGHGNILRFVGNGVLTPRISRGNEIAGSGWVSPAFGVRIPASRVSFEGYLQKSSVIKIDILQ